MKTNSYRIWGLISALVLITGCSGVSQIGHFNVSGRAVLPSKVPESFSYRIADVHNANVVANIEEDTLDPANRLTVSFLKELAAINDPDAMNEAFDRAWDKNELLGKIIAYDNAPGEFIPALALAYFMLTYDDSYCWRDQTAKKIYDRFLNSITPDQVDGYCLHFYTFSLIRNRHYGDAYIFLKHLKQITPPPVYLKNLTIALSSVNGKKHVNFTGKILREIIVHSQQHDLPLPRDQITAALENLQNFGGVEFVTAMLRASNIDFERLAKYEFFDHIEPYMTPEAEYYENTAGLNIKMVKIEGKNSFSEFYISKSEITKGQFFTFLKSERINVDSFFEDTCRQLLAGYPDGYPMLTNCLAKGSKIGMFIDWLNRSSHEPYIYTLATDPHYNLSNSNGIHRGRAGFRIVGKNCHNKLKKRLKVF